MASSFYRKNILSKAWDLTWTNKGLWLFGLFAAVLAIGEEYDVLVRNADILDAIPRWLDNFRSAFNLGLFEGFTESLTTFVKTNIPGTLTVLIAWIFAVVAIAWLVIVSQGALIESARRHRIGKRLTLLEGFDSGMSNFWPIFLVNVMAKVVVYGLLFIVDIPLIITYYRTGSTGPVLAMLLWTFIILFPLMVIISFVTKFANAYIVVKKLRALPSIVAGWKLFRNNMLVTLELAALLIVIKTLVTYMVVVTLINALGFPRFSSIEYLVFIVVIGFVYSWLTTFQFSSWTNLFLEFEEGRVPSKLKRIVHYILDIRETPAKPAAAKTRR